MTTTDLDFTSCGSAMIGRSIRLIPTVASTNDLLKTEAQEGMAEEGAVVITDYQSAGRGRLDRQWESPPGKSLLFSVLLFPSDSAGKLQLMGLMCSLAVLDGLIEYTKEASKNTGIPIDRISLKWPNDLLVERRKLCGILSDAGVDKNDRHFVVVGIGININQTPADFPIDIKRIATSLQLISGKAQFRGLILKSILRHLEKYYLRLNYEGFDWIAAEWLSRSGLLGKRLEISDNTKKTSGVCTRLQKDGAMQLRLTDGSIKTIYSGDVM
ncbi:MAG: biotin--[acetyl-CoA-carboxylase] ligase [Calditrichaeota bacterium]|nr:biotin--[acetyl-CoA-carboxylase] ligase [Calditrichota bacterium]